MLILIIIIVIQFWIIINHCNFNFNKKKVVLEDKQGYYIQSSYIQCNTCGIKSYNPTDIDMKYCFVCKKFH